MPQQAVTIRTKFAYCTYICTHLPFTAPLSFSLSQRCFGPIVSCDVTKSQNCYGERWQYLRFEEICGIPIKCHDILACLNKFCSLYNVPNNYDLYVLSWCQKRSFYNAIFYDGIIKTKYIWIICRPKSNAKIVLILCTTPFRVLSRLQDDVNSKTDRSYKLMFEIKLTLNHSIHSFLHVLKSFVSLKYAWTMLYNNCWNLVYTVTRVLDERVIKS